MRRWYCGTFLKLNNIAKMMQESQRLFRLFLPPVRFPHHAAVVPEPTAERRKFSFCLTSTEAAA